MDERNDSQVLRDIDERLARIEKRQLVQRRANILKLCVILAIIAVLAVILTPKITALVADYHSVMEQVDKISSALDGLNMDGLRENLDVLGSMNADKLRQAMDALTNIDFKSFSETFATLKEKLDALSKFF